MSVREDPRPMTVQDDLRDFRRHQVDEDHHLVPMPSSLYPSAQERLDKLRDELLSNPDRLDEHILEGENISTILNDIRYTRGWILFQQAWGEAGDVSAMSPDERKVYSRLVLEGKRLRGEIK